MSKELSDLALWMARLAAADGAITLKERKVLWNFAQAHNLSYRKIINHAEQLCKDVNIPEVLLIDRAHLLGQMFENFVVSLMADNNQMRLLSWRSDKVVGNLFAEDCLLPDLHVIHKFENTEVEYLIECKYRSSWGENGIDISTQFHRYYKYAKDHKLELFIALGIGGVPSNPDEFFLIPGRMMKYKDLIIPSRYKKCVCPKDADGFLRYIEHYFYKRVFNNKYEC